MEGEVTVSIPIVNSFQIVPEIPYSKKFKPNLDKIIDDSNYKSNISKNSGETFLTENSSIFESDFQNEHYKFTETDYAIEFLVYCVRNVKIIAWKVMAYEIEKQELKE